MFAFVGEMGEELNIWSCQWDEPTEYILSRARGSKNHNHAPMWHSGKMQHRQTQQTDIENKCFPLCGTV